MDTAAWYRWFAEHEARGSSRQYERLAGAVADSDEILDWLSLLPGAKRQPNLLFASVRFLGGATDSVAEFVRFLRSNSEALATTMNARSTQTNEVARCAAFLPLLSEIDGDVALIEVGASAGLCLYPDRYAYRYDEIKVGDSPLEIDVDAAGTIPRSVRLPTVTWRAGLDLTPLDVSNDVDLAWLRACIWPEHDERRRHLDLAATIIARDPPQISRGDLRDATLALIESAPHAAIKVVFHSAVLAYVEGASRRAFATTMRRLLDERDDIVWLSNESPSVVAELDTTRASATQHPDGAQFHLGRNGTELIAVTDPHGRWLRWIQQR